MPTKPPHVLITLNSHNVHPPLITRALLKHSGRDLAGSKSISDAIIKDREVRITIGSVEKAKLLIHELGLCGVSSVMISDS